MTVLGNVTYIPERTMYYEACPDCKKKVMEEGSGWRC